MVSTRIITTGRALTSSTSAPRFPRVPCSHAPPDQLRKVASTAAARPRNPVARVAYTPLAFTHRNTDFDESLPARAERRNPPRVRKYGHPPGAAIVEPSKITFKVRL